MNAQAQDYHFSQLNTSSLHLNPALTGYMSRSHRLSFKYREQWNSVLSDFDYKTFYFSYDNQVCFGGEGEFFSYGASALSDRAGTHEFTTVAANLSFAYHRPMGRYSFMGFGGQVGMLNYSLGNHDFKFDVQYGSTGYLDSNPNFENFEQYSTGFMPDLNFGAFFYNTKHNYEIGLAAFHLTEPSYSFLELPNANSPKVYTRFVLHAAIQLLANHRSNFLNFRSALMIQKFVPEVLYWEFLPAVEWNRRFRYKKTSFLLSLGGRISKNAPLGRPLIDSGIISTKINYQTFVLGLSYEVAFSKLTKVARFRTGPELSLIYFLGGDVKKCVTCTNFSNPVN